MKGIKILKNRWKAKMPKFFRNALWLCTCVSGVAIAINFAMTSGNAIAPEWWNIIYPYLVGIPAGAAAISKFAKDDKETNK